MSAPIVIVGAGQAGAKAAETLRKLDVRTPIILYGDEHHLPYQRPPLSKKFLLGHVEAAHLLLHPADFYVRNKIEVVTGRRVVKLDPDRRSVRFSDGSEQRFSKALIATGSSPRALRVPGISLHGVHAVRSIADVHFIQERLPTAERVVVIGGGYLGLEAAAVMASLGKPVTVIEAADRILKRVAGEVTAAYLAALHARHGVEILTGARITGVIGSGSVEGVALTNGTVLPADLVVSAVGGVANDELARLSGLCCDDGVFVDAAGCTGWRDVFAAGDCARFYSARYGRFVRLESVQNAIDQARAVAERMAGLPTRYDPLPWFWSDQYDTKLQIAGLSDGFDRFEIAGDQSSGSFSVSYLKADRLLAVDAVNDGKAFVRARRALTEGALRVSLVDGGAAATFGRQRRA